MNAISRAATVAAALLFIPITATAQATPKPEEIFARHVSAIGGKDAVMKISSMKTLGTMDMEALRITANVEAISAAPNRKTTKMTIPGIGDVITGYDGAVAWEVNPMSGARIKSDMEKIVAEESADFYGGLLYSLERYKKAETVGQVDFGGEKSWQVKTVRNSGKEVNEYFSVATGLHVGSQTKQESPRGVVDVVTVESNYKKFGAIMLPTRSEMTTGPQKMVFTTSDVVLGELPASAFALPEPIKALVKP